MAKYTPMIEQYLEIKARAEDAFLFFRLGDFYEMFFEDAIKAAQELEITLTARAGGPDEKIPMCGVPHHSASQYITRLINKGYKVAICEQIEDPAEAKGIVQRDIVRVITPGTVMEDQAMADRSNNFIVSLTVIEETLALAACDISTGELYVTQMNDTVSRLLDEALLYDPAELVVDERLSQPIKEALTERGLHLVVTPWSYDGDRHGDRHGDHHGDRHNDRHGDRHGGRHGDRHMDHPFASSTWDELQITAKRSVLLLLSYLEDTQRRSLKQITDIRSYTTEQYMIMDTMTRRNLELVETVRDREKKGSLFWLLDRTMTAMGARQLRHWIHKPLMNKALIDERLEAVDALYHNVMVREEVRQQLKGVYDIERLVGRVAYGNANARDLLALKHSLSQVPHLFESCDDANSSTLRNLVSGVDPCSDIMAWIEQAIVDEPPISIRDGGMIKAGYDEQLDRLHDASTNGKQWMAELEQREREATGIKSLKVSYNRNFGYYIEVTKANIHALPEGRYERKQTLTNAERYVTPELKEMESLILEAEEKIVQIEYELFLALRERIATEILRLQKLAEVIAQVDVYQSLATVSAANRYQKPEISEGYDMHIEEGRHPVVEAVLSEDTYIANDVVMREDEQRTLLITGPNMAGKSTYMRQVAYICIMAQIGCFVPAQSAVIPIIDRIFTRIGAADDLIGGQSTFMVEMIDIKLMTEKATKQSLVIIDELGRGTSTGEGMAIAQAVIEFIHDEIGCKTLVSTHFHELAHLEQSLPHLQNHCMAVKESGEEVTFLRKLIKGAAGTSYGIYCARIAGLPDPIIQRSYTLLDHFETRADQRAQPAPQVEQLQLFQAQPEPIDPQTEQVIDQLRSCDVMNMTPLEAMQLLYQLKQDLQTS